MKKKKVPVFLICYLLFLSMCIGFWCVVIGYVQKCLVRYEASQPERLVEELEARVKAEGPGGVFARDIETSRFEASQTVMDYYDGKLQEKELTWRQDKSSYSASAPVYRFYAGGEWLGSVTLREVSSEPLMFILSLSEWEIASLEPAVVEGQESVTVTVADSCSVLINGEPAGEGERTGNETVPEQFKYAGEYVTVPKIVEYHVEKLFERPRVEILDAYGKTVAYTESYEAGRLQIEADAFTVSEMDPELSAWVLANAERYTNFFSRDLPGCQASTAPIADMFPEDSYYLVLAENYRREDMWMYSGHYTPYFEQENVTNYIRYSDDLFSCEIYFEKIIPLAGRMPGVIRTDVTHERVFYGLLNGEWKILDIQTLTQ